MRGWFTKESPVDEGGLVARLQGLGQPMNPADIPADMNRHRTRIARFRAQLSDWVHPGQDADRLARFRSRDQRENCRKALDNLGKMNASLFYLQEASTHRPTLPPMFQEHIPADAEMQDWSRQVAESEDEFFKACVEPRTRRTEPLRRQRAECVSDDDCGDVLRCYQGECRGPLLEF